jgi:putative PIN family toxin of toxin-antitoxin system
MLRLFLDANTIISGLLFEGNESTLLEYGRHGLCTLITNEYVRDEVNEVLGRVHFDLGKEEKESLLAYLRECVMITRNPGGEEVKKHAALLKDKKDAPVLAGAIQTQSHYLVTGDKELLRQKAVKSLKTKEAIDGIYCGR